LAQKEGMKNQEPHHAKPWHNLKEYFVNPEILRRIPKALAAKHLLLPVELKGEVLHILMENPKDLAAIDNVRRVIKARAIIPHGDVGREELLEAIDRNYGTIDSVHDIVEEIHKERIESGIDITIAEDKEEKEDLLSIAEKAPIIKLVNHMIMKAIQDKASDIHVEPDEKNLRVRVRRDGVLQESHSFDKDMEGAILARIKIISGMDIAERRKPQDGRIKIMLESKKIDVRVSSLPTFYGENIVLRLLDKTTVSRDLEGLGMGDYTLDEFRRLIHFPHGILLVTGPTGSGKSTTLYATLCEINDISKNIVTVEDPIEYDIETVRQTQVNPKIGLTFANGLRTILRQDPDVIMVGEIRDTETAEIAVQAALTGHLVLSTLHTNDSIGAITRLVDMGIPPYLIASSVIGVLAQRLIRKICPHCRESVKVPSKVLDELEIKDKNTSFYGGKGCGQCNNQGYLGRTSIHEFFSVSRKMRELISKKESEDELTQVARKQGMRTLRESGVEKAHAGITSLEEVLEATRRDTA